MFWEPRPIEGTPYKARALTVRELLKHQAAVADLGDEEAMISLLARCVVHADSGEPVMSADEWRDAPAPLFLKANPEVMAVNGLNGDPVETAEGN